MNQRTRSGYYMQVRITGPRGEVIDDWREPLPEAAIKTTVFGCVFDPALTKVTAARIIDKMMDFLSNRGWRAPTPVTVPKKVSGQNVVAIGRAR